MMKLKKHEINKLLMNKEFTFLFDSFPGNGLRLERFTRGKFLSIFRARVILLADILLKKTVEFKNNNLDRVIFLGP